MSDGEKALVWDELAARRTVLAEKARP